MKNHVKKLDDIFVENGKHMVGHIAYRIKYFSHREVWLTTCMQATCHANCWVRGNKVTGHQVFANVVEFNIKKIFFQNLKFLHFQATNKMNC